MEPEKLKLAYRTCMFFAAILFFIISRTENPEVFIEEKRNSVSASVFPKFFKEEPFFESGEEIFKKQCMQCHTIGGDYRDSKATMNGLNEAFIYEIIGRLPIIEKTMPGFNGTDEERKSLAKFLAGLNPTPKKLTTGKEVFDKRCGICHTKNEEIRPLYDTFYAQTDIDVLEMLPILGDIVEDMAPWSGTEEEAKLLAQYIISWYDGNSKN